MKRHPIFRWVPLVACGVFLAGAPATAATYQSFVLSNDGSNGLIAKLVASGSGGLSLYQVLLSIQGSSNPSVAGVLTPAFMSALASLPPSSAVFTTQLISFQNPGSAAEIGADGSVQFISAIGATYQGAPGTSTLTSNIPGAGNAKFISSTTAGGTVTSLTSGGNTYNVIGIAFSGEWTFILSNEGANGLISQLVAAGSGSLNLYQTLVQLAADLTRLPPGPLPAAFLNALANNPASSAIFTTPLSSFNVPGEEVAISTDGSAQLVSITGQGSVGLPAITVETGFGDYINYRYDGYPTIAALSSGGTVYNVFAIGFIETFPAAPGTPVPGTPAPPSLWLTITGCLALFGYALWSRRRASDITSAGG